MQVAIQTNVKPQHQKLILKAVKGKLDDLQSLRSLHLQQLDKLMIIGNEEKDIPSDQAEVGDVVDDLDEDLQYAKEDQSVLQVPDHRQKLERYKQLIDITFINPPRSGKKLLVLDVDFTLLDIKTEAEDYTQLKRPFTHRQHTRTLLPVQRAHHVFVRALTTCVGCGVVCCRLPCCAVSALRAGDLEPDVVAMAGDETHRGQRSAPPPGNAVPLTSLRRRLTRLLLPSPLVFPSLLQLGMLTHPRYKILFVLDKSVMFRVTSSHGGAARRHHVKPLPLIWHKLPHFSALNTVHVDDLARNFAMNPQSGLKIKAYKNSTVTRAHDRELLYLAEYLRIIAALDDFTQLDHSQWREFMEQRGRGMERIDSELRQEQEMDNG